MGEVAQGSNLNLFTYNGVDKFKSIRRAIRRGHVTPYGTVIPKRPFNNRKRTDGRVTQLLQEDIYEQLKRKYKAK